jgi:hypothetical protein
MEDTDALQTSVNTFNCWQTYLVGNALHSRPGHGYPDSGFSSLFSVAPVKTRKVSEIRTQRSLPDRFPFIIDVHVSNTVPTAGQQLQNYEGAANLFSCEDRSKLVAVEVPHRCHVTVTGARI